MSWNNVVPWAVLEAEAREKLVKCPNCLGCGTVWAKRTRSSDRRMVPSMRCPMCKGKCKVPA